MMFHSLPPANLNHYFGAFGKSLLLAQKFEDSCKFIVRNANISVAIKEEVLKIIDLFNNNKAANNLKNQKLGNILDTRGQKIIENGLLTREIIELLKIAVKNRNWLAHNGLLNTAYIFSGESTDRSNLKISTQLEFLKEQMEPIIRSEYVLGSIYIEMNDKSPFYDPKQEDDYTKKIFNWIFDSDNTIKNGYNILLSFNPRPFFKQ